MEIYDNFIDIQLLHWLRKIFNLIYTRDFHFYESITPPGAQPVGGIGWPASPVHAACDPGTHPCFRPASVINPSVFDQFLVAMTKLRYQENVPVDVCAMSTIPCLLSSENLQQLSSISIWIVSIYILKN